ncbi:MAG: hypothetical protein QM582_18650 [Micropruina sp.]|uniref:hypothetical protein n=1 Tax=Micropruina sp. TaxID=2737536 RepID=UPI0039E2B70A
MSNQQYSPWAEGDGFGIPRPQPQPARPEDPPTLPYPASGYAEPTGWSEPQQFGALPPQPQYPAPATAYGAVQRPPYGVPGELPEHPDATVVLTLGILGTVALFVMFPFICPVAWYLGNKARREMRLNPGRYRPSGSITAGYVLGMIGTLIALCGVAVVVLGIMAFALFS